MKGCFSLMVGMNKSLNLDYDAALIENEDIAWFAVNNSKPGRINKNCLIIPLCVELNLFSEYMFGM